MTTPHVVGIGASILLLASLVTWGLPAPTVMAQSDGGATTVDSCTTISDPGRYVLAGDLSDSEEDACIRIEASDVVLDGNGYAIEGVRTETDIEAATDDTLPPRTNVGVAVGASDTISNVTVKDVTVRGWFYGIVYDDVSTVVVRDSVVTENGVGVHVRNSSDVMVGNVTPTNNVISGILIEHTGGTVTNTPTGG